VFNDLEHDTIDTRYLLKFLFRLDESDSLKFYRLYLAEPFGRLYRKLTQRDVPITLDKFVTEGIRKFLELDLFLSPFTSFPINFPVDLLFGRPFERLYTDFYLCDEEDIKKLIRRAHIVYSNFIDVVSAGVVSSGIPVSDLEALLKLYIFYWNIASKRLDWLCIDLKELTFSNDRESSIYHIYSGTTGLEIMDLVDGKLLEDCYMMVGGDYDYLLPSNLDDPTKEIRICNCFEEEGLKTEKMLYEDVLSGIRLKLKNATIDEGDDYWVYRTEIPIGDSNLGHD
jgi:hypothetical protein